VSYSDPFVPEYSYRGRALHAMEPGDALRAKPDCMVVCTDHSSFNWQPVVDSGIPIIDSRNALNGYAAPNIVRLSGRRVGGAAPGL